jgi:GntR family transcriptional regulator, transcriptional repressor for pyruvate dehydrogenase complex
MNQRLSHTKLSDTIAAELEQRILEGSWKVGDKIPAERELSTQLGVSRASLREAIQKLVNGGLLNSQQGGGTYVTNQLTAGFIEPWEGLLQNHPSVREDLLEFRELIESKAAACAAQRATTEDKARLKRCFEALDRAYIDGTVDELADADLNFHQAVAEASHNAIIGHMTSSLLRILHDNLRLNLSELIMVPDAREHLRKQHRSIWEAINQGETQVASGHAAEHVEYVRATLNETLKRESRRESAARRLQTTK